MPAVAEIVREIRYRPRIAAELLRDLLAVQLPSFNGLRAESLGGGSASADQEPLLVVLTLEREPVFSIVVDAPSDCDSPTRVLWPRWARSAADRLNTPSAVLIITIDPVIERWAKQPVHLEGEPPFHPFVIGPSSIPSDGQKTPIIVLMALAAKITQQA
jgi:hypothetical protein